ncbi:hypothetical protein BH708_12230 [Brachybacterium sp. P6-10-X1]|uniref:hypothetical protein n=1 Tax=Brachybacterium sp. P6-10-X1 TaxID=1903186 RepID=UPI0009718C93|nr:hypothetical protein [Brachybacterium sp. P6-10-X1]APX33355.1 hypothetical protein BH708_12230 [Brachybacterium sp. P6-10-X1]
MKNATIATSRTRATTDDLIDYRPLPAAWGDVEALHAVRAARAGAAERGLDPTTVEITGTPETPRPARESSRRRRGAHRRRGHGLRRLAVA